MKKKELESLRKKDIKELTKTLEDKKKEYILTYSQVKAGQEKDTRKPTNIRKEVAQILTTIKEKEIIEKSLSKGEKEADK
jgi:ribosomal protein L29